MATPTYEFSADQNDVLTVVASRLRVVGVSLLLLGVMLAAWAVLLQPTRLGVIILAALLLGVSGFWGARAAGELKRVVTTQGADMSHLMHALREIRAMFELPYWIFILLALLLLVTILAAVSGVGIPAIR